MDGRQVAVKVQYPGLRGAANADLTTLSVLSAAAAALFPEFRLSWLYDELRLKLTEELGGCQNNCVPATACVTTACLRLTDCLLQRGPKGAQPEPHAGSGTHQSMSTACLSVSS